MSSHNDGLREILEKYITTYHSSNGDIAAKEAIADINALRGRPVGWMVENLQSNGEVTHRAGPYAGEICIDGVDLKIGKEIVGQYVEDLWWPVSGYNGPTIRLVPSTPGETRHE